MSDHERAAAVSRETSETTIDLTLAIDGDGDSEVDTGSASSITCFRRSPNTASST